jgi:alpha-beta hydrolase superfamily lysophospholipase
VIADPAVIAYDEAHKDAYAGTLLAEAGVQVATPAPLNVTDGITVPVLSVSGGSDVLFCGAGEIIDCTSEAAVRAFEAPYYLRAPSYTARVVAGSGHDLALHPTNDVAFQDINTWLMRRQ